MNDVAYCELCEMDRESDMVGAQYRQQSRQPPELGGGLDTSDPTSATLVRKSCVKRYTKRRSTRFEHAEQI
ncbi:MAG: hypothetical protein ACRDOU_30665 [Streptosporangiaceae bacterium]